MLLLIESVKGFTQVIVEDLREDFVQKYVWPAVSYGLIYESRYLLGTSLARPCISEGLIKSLNVFFTDQIVCDCS